MAQAIGQRADIACERKLTALEIPLISSILDGSIDGVQLSVLPNGAVATLLVGLGCRVDLQSGHQADSLTIRTRLQDSITESSPARWV